MAKDTPFSYRNLVLYQVYTRNHSPAGDFAGVEADLERIRSMGVDVVYLLPIHPLGKIARKGTLGSPYSIVDYRAINPEYGTLPDFQRLVGRIHDLGMKVMIDVVYNHTAHDSVLVQEHPDWFHQDEHGRPVTTVPEWSDVIDLKHPNPELSAYLVDTIVYWVQQGVDGFRCDVASLVPVEFWQQARAAAAALKPGIIWLAEAVHPDWVTERRANGLFALSDSELYSAFDILYDYDAFPSWQHAARGDAPVRLYLDTLRLQDGIFPSNYAKLRYVENHDTPRVMHFAPSRKQAQAWTAFAAFNKGPFFIYGGQESACQHRPSLFDIDKVDWGDYELQDFLTRLSGLKKHPAQQNGHLVFLQSEPALLACWVHGQQSLLGVFNPGSNQGETSAPIEDGDYQDLLADQVIAVKGGRISIPETAVILECSVPARPRPYRSPVMDGYGGLE